jgi:hypothetical protein
MPTAKDGKKAPTRHCRPPRQQALVLVHADGFLEIFGPADLDVRVVDVPRVAPTPAAELAAEQYVEATVPLPYRQLHAPGNRRAMHMPRVRTPETIAHTMWELQLLREIQSIRPKEEQATWRL